MAGNAKEADIWFGRESAREARGKFKDLVCLVVFLCWIKRFVLLSLCLKCKYMNRYFSSFQKSRGGRSPQKNSRGGHVPPVPPGIAAYWLIDWLIERFYFRLIQLKGLSHWRRRRRNCRDWSVAATPATRETKKWLALSPRRRRRDCRDRSVAATRETKTWLVLSRRGDVSETYWRLKKSPKNRTCLNFPRLLGDPASLQETSRRRRGDSSRHLVAT